jgi:hypothetical protein
MSRQRIGDGGGTWLDHEDGVVGSGQLQSHTGWTRNGGRITQGSLVVGYFGYGWRCECGQCNGGGLIAVVVGRFLRQRKSSKGCFKVSIVATRLSCSKRIPAKASTVVGTSKRRRKVSRCTRGFLLGWFLITGRIIVFIGSVIFVIGRLSSFSCRVVLLRLVLFRWELRSVIRSPPLWRGVLSFSCLFLCLFLCLHLPSSNVADVADDDCSVSHLWTDWQSLYASECRLCRHYRRICRIFQPWRSFPPCRQDASECPSGTSSIYQYQL